MSEYQKSPGNYQNQSAFAGNIAQSGRPKKQEPAEGARAPVGIPVL
ncbi:MAG TPA: hypothetical protein VIY48_06085 [Candidatus Paceibacterota bacterium]